MNLGDLFPHLDVLARFHLDVILLYERELFLQFLFFLYELIYTLLLSNNGQ